MEKFTDPDFDVDSPDAAEWAAGSRGSILAPEDIKVNDYIALHSIKMHNEPSPLMGQAVLVTAVNLPFLVTYAGEPITFDVRYVNFIRVSKEFVEAQKAK